MSPVELLEAQIAEWRTFVERRPAVARPDVEELEAHLRDQISDLGAAGLAEDEAFLVAVKRMGALDDLSREFAREHSGRLWRQLVLDAAGGPGDHAEQPADTRWREAIVFAIAAAVLIQVVRLAGGFTNEDSWGVRNAGFFVIPVLAAYFARVRGFSLRQCLVAAAPCAAAAVLINVYPFDHDAATAYLVAAHLPVALWFLVAYPYMSGGLRSHEQRMDFVRFTGEWFIYYVLIALGGGVLVALTGAVLNPTGVDVKRVMVWIVPSGAAGAVIIAAWLVEAKQRVIENMAPVLTMLFTPLFALMLTVAAVVYPLSALGKTFDRNLVSVFDALLVVVLGLVLYGMSARDPSAPAGWMDRIQLVAIGAALLLDVMVLGAMVARIGDLGFSANRTAALGLNVVLLVNLAGAGWLASRFVGGHTTFHQLERWQTSYMPVLAVWVAAVVVFLPPLFAFG